MVILDFGRDKIQRALAESRVDPRLINGKIEFMLLMGLIFHV